jgi:rhodanese-related sulfurtransferase
MAENNEPKPAARGELASIDPITLRQASSGTEELALIDPREEGAFGRAHLLLAVNVPLSRLELLIERLVPRKSTRIVLTDDGDGLSELAAGKLAEFGYANIELLRGGNPAWGEAGFELFSGLSVPTKAFGEWIAVTCKTPLISAEALHRKIAAGADVVILDSRPANEYADMTIPGAINVPVSELVYRFGELPVAPLTEVVVNCAGRTRSLIGAQTLIDAGIPNPVAALQGGTMAWQMAGFPLEHGATRHAPEPWGGRLVQARQRAEAVAERNRVRVIDQAQLALFKSEVRRTLYVIDVRSPDEFGAGHRADSSHAWGVQLVQSLDRFVATRNARLVLVDNFRVRALTTASWLVQAGWRDTFVLEDPFSGVALETGSGNAPLRSSAAKPLPRLNAAELREALTRGVVTVVDFSSSLTFAKAHIPGAWFGVRSRLAELLAAVGGVERFVVTGTDPALAELAGDDLRRLSGRPVALLDGGNRSWSEAGFEPAFGPENLAAAADDLFRMPFLWGHFQDRDEFESAARAYLDWELQLPEQLRRAGEIGFPPRG